MTAHPDTPKRRNRFEDRIVALHKRMAAMRAAKERKRLSGPAPERPPRRVRETGLLLGVRDRFTQRTAWTPLVSVRDAARRLSVVLKFYQPGQP